MNVFLCDLSLISPIQSAHLYASFRQFERTFRHIQSLAEYDVMFLMEADTFPIADNWLDNLVEEIEASAPFALLGR